MKSSASGKLQPRGDCVADIDKIQQDIIKKSDVIAKSIKSGKDVEIRKTTNGISVAEVSKKVVVR